MQLKLENGSAKRYICDKCGFTDTTPDTFNPSDSIDGKDYCLKCHPMRMTYIQLLEWLAKGHGFLCQQARDYCTAPTFNLSPVRINDRKYPGTSEDQIPYNEHELVVRCFDESKRTAYWEIPTLEMFNRDCRQPMFGNYYGIMEEHPITKDFVKMEVLLHDKSTAK